MNLSGKKLTTAILAGLMGATVAGISVVGAANPVVLDGTTLKVSTIKGTKPIMNPVNVTKGIIDGSTTGGNIVKSDSTVGANLDALDAAVVGKADKAELDTKANQTDFNALKTKVDNAKVNTALHVDKDGKLVVGTDKKVNKAVSVEKGFKDGTTEAGQGNIVSADNTVGRNLTALDNAIEANKQAVDNTLATKADKADLDNAKVNTALHVDKDGKLVVGTDKKVNKSVSVEKGFKDGTTEAGQGNIVSADNTVGQNLTALDNAVATNQKAISTETKERAAADKTLQDNIDAEATARDQAVAQERAERKGADAAQDKVIKQVNDNLVSSVNTINKNVADGFNALSAVDLQEAQTRAAADQTLQNQIANNVQAIGTTKDGNYVKSNNSVGQNLNVLDAQVGQNSANINQLFSDYSSMKTDINKVGARSAALAGLHPLDFDPANKLNFAVASGSFKGENSVALGAFYRPNENVMFSAASTMGDSDNAYTFGLSFKIGPSSAKTKTTSPDAEELYKVVGQLQDQLAAQQKEIEQLKAEKAAK